MTLCTLADVRKLMRHLPAECRERSTWQHVAAELDKAATGADLINVVTALRVVLMLERVECRCGSGSGSIMAIRVARNEPAVRRLRA
jgi:hypothetical protein